MAETPRLGAQAARGAATLISLRGLLWLLAIAQNVVVARALPPHDLGLYATALALVSLASRLKQVGSAEKLVRDREEELAASLSAALVVEAAAAVLAIVVLVAAAVLVGAGFGGRARLMIVFLGVLLFQAVAELPAALFHRRLEFRSLATRRFASSLVTVVVTIALVLLGFGLSALVIGQIAGVAASSFAFWRGVAPRPCPALDAVAIRRYLAFGLPLWGSGLLYALAERGSVLVVSSVLGLTTLGYVHLAQGVTARLTQANDAANAAIYPALRALGAGAAALRSVLERTIRVFALCGMTLGSALALSAAQWVPLLFGAKWRPAVPFVAIYCLAWGISAIGYPCYLVFQVRGDTRTLFWFGSVSFVGRFLCVAAGAVLFGEAGLLVAIACGAAINVLARSLMIRRCFADLSLLGLAMRPVLIVGAAVAIARGAERVAAGAYAPAVGLAGFAVAWAAGALLFDRASLLDVLAQAAEAVRGVTPKLAGRTRVGAPCS